MGKIVKKNRKMFALVEKIKNQNQTNYFGEFELVFE